MYFSSFPFNPFQNSLKHIKDKTPHLKYHERNQPQHNAKFFLKILSFTPVILNK